MSELDTEAKALEEARRLWEQYKLSYGAGTPTGADTADQGKNALVRAFEAIGRPAGAAFGGAMHVLEAPARFVNAIGTNAAGTAPHVDVPSYTLYGRDMETGRTPTSYGEVLAGELADRGEITPGGKAEKIIRVAGDIVSDPGAAPLLLSGGEAAGALGGRLSKGAGSAAKALRRPGVPRSRLHPSYREPPKPPKPSASEPLFNDSTQPVMASERTQPVRAGEHLFDDSTRPVPKFTETQPVETVTQRVPTTTQALRVEPPFSDATQPVHPSLQTQPIQVSEAASPTTPFPSTPWDYATPGLENRLLAALVRRFIGG